MRERGLEDRSVIALVYRLLNRLSFAVGQLAVFQGANEDANLWIDTVDRATRENSQLAGAQRIAACSSVTYQYRNAPSLRLAGGPF